MRILVYRIGQLGDFVVSLPAIWAIRDAYPTAHLTLLTDHHPGKPYVVAEQIFGPSTIFQDIIRYEVPPAAAGFTAGTLWQLIRQLRATSFDLLVYLAPSVRRPGQILRDRLFFRVAGITRAIGFRGFPPQQKGPYRDAVVPLEADLLVERLRADGMAVPGPGAGKMDLQLGEPEAASVHAWRRSLAPDGGRPWLAVGIGSKMPSKVWPLERYIDAVGRAVREFDCWPVVFGGPEDRKLGERLLSTLGRGYNAAGLLDVRSAACAMSRCRGYLGNDTGTMHLAAAVGVPCVAIFSARARPGEWYPYGQGHRVLRHSVPCAGCELIECNQEGHPCLTGITVDEASAALKDVWASPVTRRPCGP